MSGALIRKIDVNIDAASDNHNFPDFAPKKGSADLAYRIGGTVPGRRRGPGRFECPYPVRPF